MSLHIPVSPTSDTPVRVGRLYPCTPLRYMHRYDAVCPSSLFTLTQGIEGWVRPERG